MSKLSAFLESKFGIPQMPFWATVKSIGGGQLVALFKAMGLAKVQQFVNALDGETFDLFRAAVRAREVGPDTSDRGPEASGRGAGGQN